MFAFLSRVFFSRVRYAKARSFCWRVIKYILTVFLVFFVSCLIFRTRNWYTPQSCVFLWSVLFTNFVAVYSFYCRVSDFRARHRYADMYNKNGRIGIYTRQEREAIIARFKRKRGRRVWKKKIRCVPVGVCARACLYALRSINIDNFLRNTTKPNQAKLNQHQIPIRVKKRYSCRKIFAGKRAIFPRNPTQPNPT